MQLLRTVEIDGRQMSFACAMLLLDSETGEGVGHWQVVLLHVPPADLDVIDDDTDAHFAVVADTNLGYRLVGWAQRSPFQHPAGRPAAHRRLATRVGGGRVELVGERRSEVGRWDYRTVVLTGSPVGDKKGEIDRCLLEDELDALGNEGFELVHVCPHQRLYREKDGHLMIFKRWVL